MKRKGRGVDSSETQVPGSNPTPHKNPRVISVPEYQPTDLGSSEVCLGRVAGTDGTVAGLRGSTSSSGGPASGGGRR